MPSPFDLFFLVVYERRFLSAKGHRRPRNSAGSSVAGVLHQRRKWDRLSHGHDPPGQVWPPAPPGRRPFARGRRAEYCCLTTKPIVNHDHPLVTTIYCQCTSDHFALIPMSYVIWNDTCEAFSKHSDISSNRADLTATLVPTQTPSSTERETEE